MKFINWLGHRGDFGHHSAVGTPLSMLIAFMIIGPLGTLFNMLVIVGVLSNRRQWKPYNIYMLNVCIADLLISAVYIPYNAYAGMSNEEPTGCFFLGAMYNFLATVSVMMLAALAFSRYRLIKLPPDRYQKEFSPKRTFASIVIIGMISLIFLLVVASGTVMSGFNHVLGVCVTIPDWFDILLFEILQVTIIGIPSYGIIVFSYISIYYVAKAKAISFGSGKMPRSVRLSLNLFIVTAVYTVCWVPGMLLSFIDSQHRGNDVMHQIATMLNLVHCMLNPAVYLFLNEGLRRSLGNICRPQAKHEQDTTTSQDHEKSMHFHIIKPKWLVKVIERSKLMFELVILKRRTRSIGDSSHENKSEEFIIKVPLEKDSSGETHCMNKGTYEKESEPSDTVSKINPANGESEK